ncbi:MAG: hypothetical protein IH849_15365, partial [Acidobacteria bacterium]|nr:hypothetical protein [Acidobacteriota bacterium]
MDRPALVDLLIRHLAAGSLETEHLLPAISALLPDEPTSLSKAGLYESLQEQEGEAFERLRQELERDLVKAALELNALAHQRQPIPEERRRDLEGFPLQVPLSWRSQADGLAALQRAVSLL